MNCEWDEDKNLANRKKHEISFEEAMHVFTGLHLSRIDCREDYGEVRELTIGKTAHAIIALVVHTERDDAVRIFSARRANKRERKAYHAYCAKNTERPLPHPPEPD